MCGVPGELRFEGLRDTAGSAPGEWSFRACGRCPALWLDPQPVPPWSPLLYRADYVTHRPPQNLLGASGGLRDRLKLEVLHRAYGYPKPGFGAVTRALGAVTALWKPLTLRLGYLIRFVPAGPGPLLEVGCGNGEFLLTMSRLGWQVRGLEPDPAAAALAREAGLAVEAVTLEDAILESGWGVIVLHHVIEHLADPVAALSRLSRLLRPGGLLVSFSPNPAGLLARRLGPAWRQLDTPRHLVLLGPAALAAAARRAGLEPVVWTSARMCQWSAEESLARVPVGSPRLRRRLARAIHQFCGLWRVLAPASGEEVILSARRPAS